jgi:hypothetical protein
MSEPKIRPSIADTFSKLLRLNLANGPPLVTRNQLMEESEARIEFAAHRGTPFEQQIAAKLLASPAAYRNWEAVHALLMATVARPHRSNVQATTLLTTAFTLVHRKAFFEYLRGQSIRGRRRRDLVQHFHSSKSYTQAVVAEHYTYLHSSASMMCVERFGETILAHQAFGDPFRRYEQAYAAYFRSYCHNYLAPTAVDNDISASVRPLVPQLKRDVSALRAKLLAMPVAALPGASSRR